MEKAFASWSGGKDCCLAAYRAIKSGLNVSYLLNMVSEDGQVSRSHGLAARWIQMQAKAIGITLVQQRTGDNEYEAQFKCALSRMKQDGVTVGVFGDIDFNAHREWVDRVCADAGMVPRLPLWEEDQNKLVKEFIDAGFEAVVVATKADILGKEWLGRKLDHQFLADLAKIKGITPCGEAGEYHTLVVNGPIFKKRLELTETEKELRGEHWFLNIANCEVKAKK